MKHILIAVPTFENIDPACFKSIYDQQQAQDAQYYFNFVKGYDCARARNLIAKYAIDPSEHYDYVFMVDSDVILPKYALDTLLSDNKEVILGYYPRKTDPATSELFKKVSGKAYEPENKLAIKYLTDISNNENPIIEVNGGGFGCALIKTSVFSKLDYPYFNYVNYPDGLLLSEDLYFCSQVRGRGIRIYADTRVKCKHIAKRIIDC